jgi:hypothetical protein
MAYTVSSDTVAGSEIAGKLQALFDSMTGTYVTHGIKRIAADSYLVYLIEAST